MGLRRRPGSLYFFGGQPADLKVFAVVGRRLIAMGLMVLAFCIYLLGQKISRTMELIDTTWSRESSSS